MVLEKIVAKQLVEHLESKPVSSPTAVRIREKYAAAYACSMDL